MTNQIPLRNLLMAVLLSLFALNLTAASRQAEPAGQAQVPAPTEIDPWAPFKLFVGRWQGRGSDQNGAYTGKIEFQFILGGKFLQVKNETRFDPKEKQPKGWTREDLAFFSFDRTRGIYVFRQFQAEGTVIQSICRKILDEGKTFIFVSEQNENIPPGSKERLTYKVINPGEFQMTIDRAAPDKDYVSDVLTTFKKIR